MSADKKKRRKKRQQAVLEEVPVSEQKLHELMAALEELKKKGKLVDIPICPRCKSARVRRVRSMEGDMSGQMGMTSPMLECPDCGWRGRAILKATNRPMDKKHLAVVAYAFYSGRKGKKSEIQR
jgi:uncharacterized protein with PIN domain